MSVAGLFRVPVTVRFRRPDFQLWTAKLEFDALLECSILAHGSRSHRSSHPAESGAPVLTRWPAHRPPPHRAPGAHRRSTGDTTSPSLVRPARSTLSCRMTTSRINSPMSGATISRPACRIGLILSSRCQIKSCRYCRTFHSLHFQGIESVEPGSSAKARLASCAPSGDSARPRRPGSARRARHRSAPACPVEAASDRCGAPRGTATPRRSRHPRAQWAPKRHRFRTKGPGSGLARAVPDIGARLPQIARDLSASSAITIDMATLHRQDAVLGAEQQSLPHIGTKNQDALGYRRSFKRLVMMPPCQRVHRRWPANGPRSPGASRRAGRLRACGRNPCRPTVR